MYVSLSQTLSARFGEFIWFGSRCNLAKIPSEYRSFTVAFCSIHCAHTVRNLGAMFDSELSNKSRNSKTASACFSTWEGSTIARCSEMTTDVTGS